MNYKTNQTLMATINIYTRRCNSNIVDLFGAGGIVSDASKLIWTEGAICVPERNLGQATWAHAWSDIIIAASEVLKETEMK